MLPVSQLTSTTQYMPAASSDAVRVVLVADDPLTRAGLAAVLGAFDDVLVLAGVGAAEREGDRVRLLAPDVLIVDGTETSRFSHLDVPTLLLSGEGMSMTAALASGARGLIARDASPQRIHAAIRAVGEGLFVFDEDVTTAAAGDDAEPLAEPLTGRELEVLQLLAAGLTNKEIGSRLGITDHTVKFHVNAILGKLEAETRTEAVVQAARRGLVTL